MRRTACPHPRGRCPMVPDGLADAGHSGHGCGGLPQRYGRLRRADRAAYAASPGRTSAPPPPACELFGRGVVPHPRRPRGPRSRAASGGTPWHHHRVCRGAVFPVPVTPLSPWVCPLITFPPPADDTAAHSLTLQHVNYQAGEHQILKDISLHVSSGELIAIVGRNGAGKSTLLHVLAGLLPVSQGDVRLNGQPLSHL